MPLVFVHGVNNRMNDEYRWEEQQRNALLSRFVLPGLLSDPDPKRISSPYWGDLASTFAWNHGCLPGALTEGFGADDDPVEGVIEEIGLDGVSEHADRFLLELAQIDFGRTIDLLLAAAAVNHDLPGNAEEFAELAAIVNAYARENPAPQWLRDDRPTDDLKFVDLLAVKVDEWKQTPEKESFGLGSAVWDRIIGTTRLLRDAAGKVWNRGAAKIKGAAATVSGHAGPALASGVGALTNPLVRTIRPQAQLRFAYFVGDVFVYLTKRGTPGQEGPIVERVADAIEAAFKQATPTDPLILLAHSMGGPICYDILTHFRPQLKVDMFVTVGSQVAFFEEAKLYGASTDRYSAANQNRVPQPANIKKWINVFDPVDPLGFAVEKVFQGPQDFEWTTGTHVGSAHGYYFVRPEFYHRLATRLKACLP